jgi:tetratricopeptide (TPR) repeat protein
MTKTNAVRIWAEDIQLPTYLVGRPNRNPMFLEKRVYQGSSGRVYPYPVIDKIYDQKVQECHRVVFLENRYLKLMVMPGLGGRIQYAYDKTNHYPFIYHNRVIKPALVGLTGPWLSGGIEFNWPQHHRPGTYCPVDYAIVKSAGGSSTLWLSELEPMWHLKGTLGMTLYSDRAVLEITIRLFNPTKLPQSFHLWTNPAVHVNEQYQSVFPPDVQAVYDHGKRDVSSFPIARGQYYKVDYSRGVDISWYKNIPVPTSYMAAQSNYDFVGGYDHGRQAGMLHVADHHCIPGKKQWVWGCGDFGKAWDRNLTDADGPYAELMCGVFADNQPDFSWLQPFEEKEVKQFFLPYKGIGYVRNATIEAAASLELEGRIAKVGAYATKARSGALIILRRRGEVFWSKRTDLGPEQPFTAQVPVKPGAPPQNWELSISSAEGQCLVAYRPEPRQELAIPEPATAIPRPGEIPDTEGLWLAGKHLEQYRHATREPENYYREALRRDPNDMRHNNSLGLLLMRRGQFEQAEAFFRTAIKSQTRHNPNPPDGEPYYNLGVCLTFLDRLGEAYNAFYKAAWNAAWQDSAFFNLAQISARQGILPNALQLVESSLDRNSHNQKAAHLKVVLLRKLGRLEDALRLAKKSVVRDPLDFGARNELALLGDSTERETMIELMGHSPHSYLAIAADYAQAGAYTEASDLLKTFLRLDVEAQNDQHQSRAPGHVAEAGMPNARPMVFYFLGYYAFLEGDSKLAKTWFAKTGAQRADCCFPNSLDSILALRAAQANNPRDGLASLYLGNLWYDKRQVAEAKQCWKQASRFEPSLPTVHRNLALIYFNKENNPSKALRAMARAFALDQTDARVLFELDQLKKRAQVRPEKRLAFLRKHYRVLQEREDLLVEFVTLLNSLGLHQEAFRLLMDRKFHPWEGGEGKVVGQYVISLVEMAKELLRVFEPLSMERSRLCNPGSQPERLYADEPLINPDDTEAAARLAIKLLERARVYPENLGEGKLHGTQENHVLYWLGVANAQAGDTASARKCWSEASTGMKTPTPAVYYNDQNPETIFYQGLALEKLDRSAVAAKRFETLIEFGRRHLKDEIEIDYFAVSLPEFMIFDDDLNLRNQINCLYLIGLGQLGLRRDSAAQSMFNKVLQLEPAHQGARLHLRLLRHLEQEITWNRREVLVPGHGVQRTARPTHASV